MFFFFKLPCLKLKSNDEFDKIMGNECGICYNDTIYRTNCCFQILCTNCYEQIVGNNYYCPFCRMELGIILQVKYAMVTIFCLLLILWIMCIILTN